jgi:hypothetical protein
VHSYRLWQEYDLVAGWSITIVPDDRWDMAGDDIELSYRRKEVKKVPMSGNSDHWSDMVDDLQVVDLATYDCEREVVDNNLTACVKGIACYCEKTPWIVRQHRNGHKNQVDDTVKEERDENDCEEKEAVVDG